MPEIGTEVLTIFGFIVILALIAAYISSRYKVASANEALVRSGRRGKDEELKVVRGGGIMVWPLFHTLGRLKLTARQINVTLSDAVTSQGIKVALEGVATFKVGADETSIRNAAERFPQTDIREVGDIVKNVVEGSLRSIVGTLTVEELNLDRQKFQLAVQSAAIGDLATSGLVIDSFTIQAIGGEALEYMQLVGRQELARCERDARMAQADADQEARVREAEAEQTKLAELAAERKAKELLASTVRPAEAEAEAIVRRAEGDRQAAIAAAQAEAETVRLRGEAEAAIIYKTGEAEAAALEMRAEAYRHFNDAAILATILRDLPSVVSAAADPISKIDNLTILSTDGASEIVRTATSNLTQAGTPSRASPASTCRRSSPTRSRTPTSPAATRIRRYSPATLRRSRRRSRPIPARRRPRRMKRERKIEPRTRRADSACHAAPDGRSPPRRPPARRAPPADIRVA